MEVVYFNKVTKSHHIEIYVEYKGEDSPGTHRETLSQKKLALHIKITKNE